MVVLVIGVPDSGKSRLAEEIAVKLSEGKRKFYIATMIPYGKEGEERVKKHRKLRQGKGFETIECPENVGRLSESLKGLETSTCLLECMSNLVGNEMHNSENDEKRADADYIVSETAKLCKKAKNMVIVTNSFPMDSESYDEDTRKYVALVDKVNKKLRGIADEIHEYVEGEWT